MQGSQDQKIIENHLGWQVETNLEAKLACRSAKGRLGSVVGRQDRPEGIILAILGRSWNALGASWSALGVSWRHLGRLLGAFWSHLIEVWG